MSIPVLTTEQRKAAADKAVAARRKRAEFKEEINARRINVSQALADKYRKDDVIGRMRVSSFISSFPGYGPSKTAALMSRLGIAETRRLRGLGKVQVVGLIDALG